jgi:hypothetical protein
VNFIINIIWGWRTCRNRRVLAAAALERVARRLFGADRLSRFITTLPSNRTISPPLKILSLSAVSVPFSSLTSTCSSDTTVPLLMST